MRDYRINPPVMKPMPVCPVCGEECETIYTDINSEVCGCDCCIEEYDAYEYFEDEDEPDPDLAFDSQFDR